MRQLRGYSQEIAIVWLVWELVDSPAELRWVMRAYVAGTGVLAALTISNFLFASSAEQVRFVAEGQDPNDVARFLNLAFPLAALLVGTEPKWAAKLPAAAYLPLGMLGVLLTASRSGLVSAGIALSGCAVLLFASHRRASVLGLCLLPIALEASWLILPALTLARLATLPNELVYGDLNQRADIWAAGWQAFTGAPFCGYGVGSFVAAAGVAPADTAHNTILVLLVEGGVVALLIAGVLAVCSVVLVVTVPGALRVGLSTSLLAWIISSLVGTVQQNRATWLLLGLIGVAARLHAEIPAQLEQAFPRRVRRKVVTAFPQPVMPEQP